MTPLVSVCIPTYNNHLGLIKTLDCITNQTYKNLEIIVSDNCSENPNVQSVIKEFAEIDIRIKPYRQSENIGVDANYRFVITKVTGKYLLFAQDDDWWSPRFIEFLVTGLEANPTAPVAACPSRYAKGELRELSEPHMLQNISVYNTVGNGDMGFVCMGLWRTEAYKKYYIKTPSDTIGGDHMTVAHAIMGSGNPFISKHGCYLKGYTPGEFQDRFKDIFWYSFKSWYWLMKSLMQSPYIPLERKVLLPFVAFTNLFRACAITGVQIVVSMPDNPLKTWTQKKFFGAN